MARVHTGFGTTEFGDISKGEIWWRDRYIWLKDQGYQLRPRFTPEWTPSWKGTNKFYADCEDGQHLIYAQIIDAIHLSTGRRVALKKVDRKWNPLEEEITRHFSSELLSKDPRNHCVPLLDVLEPPIEEGSDVYRIMVIPFLRPFGSPIFDTFGEALECIRQLFEGLHFIHENHTAHRDINANNFMMQSENMFPDGYHPQENLRNADLSGRAKFYTRTQRPSKYFLIDFGLSRQYDADNSSPLEPIIVGGDDTVPEFQNTVDDQNPFLTDVYYAGNLVRQHFLDGHHLDPWVRGYRGFEFLKPLIDDMVQIDPQKRPKMEEVVRRFEDITGGLSTWKVRSRTSSRGANIFRDTAHMFSHWRRKIVFTIKGTPATPRV